MDRSRSTTDAQARKRLSLIVRGADLEGLEREWDDLLSAAPDGSVFQSWEWAWSWWEEFADGKELRALALRDGGGRLVGLWPLYAALVEVLPRWRLWGLRLVGTGQEVSPDYMGPLAAPEARAELVPALVGWLREVRGEWDVLWLNDVRAEAWWLPELRQATREAGMRMEVVERARCAYATLPETWEEYYGGLKRSARRQVRRRTRDLERAHRVELFRWGLEERVGPGIRLLAELHRRRWSEVGLRHSFATEGYVRFHERFARRAQARDWLDLYGLRVDGVIVSMLYLFTYRGVMHVYQSGFDPEWGHAGVGTALRAYVMKDAIARGMREVDFLKGDHRYKDEWSHGERQTVDVVVCNRTVRGLAYWSARRLEGWARAGARRVLPERVLAARRRLRDALRARRGVERRWD